MDSATRDKLRSHWITRGLEWARRDGMEPGRDLVFYRILDAACLAVPLFPDEPWIARPTAAGRKVGGVRRIENKVDLIRFRVFFEADRQTWLDKIETKELVDHLGRMFHELAFTEREKAECLDRITKWITHDDRDEEAKAGDAPRQSDAESLRETAAKRRPV